MKEAYPPSHALLVSSRALCPGSIDQHMPSPCCCEDFASFDRPEFAERWIPGMKPGMTRGGDGALSRERRDSNFFTRSEAGTQATYRLGIVEGFARNLAPR